MAHRAFQDRSGRIWQVWEVRPAAIERRLNGERRCNPRATPDRRVQAEARVVVPNDLSRGWLAFDGGGERRRLAPIPEDWLSLPDTQLQGLVERATRLNHALRVARGGQHSA